MSKPLIQSKTILVNAVLALVGLAVENLDMLRGTMPDNVFFWLLMISNMAGMYLRTITNSTVEVPEIFKLGREK